MEGSGFVRRDPAPWNHNIHYHQLILGAVPDGCRRCLDVGCGEGALARDLRRVVPRVVAIDSDEPVIDRARQQDAGAGVEYVTGDFLTYEFAPESFDVIASIAALVSLITVINAWNTVGVSTRTWLPGSYEP